MLEELSRQFTNFTREMSSTYILSGLIRLDLLLHFIMGVFLTLIIRKWKKSPIFGLSLVLLIQLIKEYYDSFNMQASLEEAFIDTIVTIAYPLILVLLNVVIKKIEKRR